MTVVGDDDQAIYRFRGRRRRTCSSSSATPSGEARAQLPLGPAHPRRRPRSCSDRPRSQKKLTGASGGRVRFWRCRSERAQAQAVAAEAEQLIAGGVPPERDLRAGALGEERGRRGRVRARGAGASRRARCGSAAYFQRAEVRDVLAWLRALADPGDSGAVVRALSRPPIELRSVDVARLTQLARRRKLDMPSAVAAALEGPQLSEEGRDRARAFLRLYRSASNAFEDRRPDAFVLRLIERIGLRRQQVFATHADTVERLRNIAKLPELATAYMRREPHATARDFTRYLAAVAESGLREEEAVGTPTAPAVQVMTMHAAKGLEFDHVFVLGLSAARDARPVPPERRRDVPDELLKGAARRATAATAHEAEMRRLLHVAMTRARKGLVLAWAETRRARHHAAAVALLRGGDARPSGVEEEVFEEELFGPAEGLHSTFRIMRDELLDTVARVGGRLGEMRLDTYLDVDQAVSRYLELIKVAALIERAKEGQTLDAALPERERDPRPVRHARAARDPRAVGARRLAARHRAATPPSCPARDQNGSEPSLDPFIPRRGRGLMLSASDIDTYRICPLKYKFARVFRIPQEPTINQRFGIVVHQVLERFHRRGRRLARSADGAVRGSWRRSGFGDSDDELQFRERARRGARALLARATATPSREPVWFERSFAFKIGPHLLRGRVDRVDRHPDGTLRADRLQDRQGQDRGGAARGRAAVRLPDGRARVVGARDLGAELLLRPDRREGAGRALRRGARAGARDRLRDRRRNPQAALRADPLAGDLPLLRLPDHLPGR